MAGTRLRIRCKGAVQGVGFRPTVFRLASELGLCGRVWNDPIGATIEVEGSTERTQGFVDRLAAAMPPLARLDGMEVQQITALGDVEFSVVESEPGPRSGALVPADAALCDHCRAEMEDPQNRRAHYAFTTCTNCGPRFSLVHRLPYDRGQTSMACFPLCPACRAEYEDPGDRRFHAEPVCCPACGPRLWFARTTGDVIAEGDAAVAAARAALIEGAIVAVKGLGGFQLACRATEDSTIARLRERKRRPSKPFAVMVRDLESAHQIVHLSCEDELLLSSPRAPVVLAPRRIPNPVVSGVAPGLEDLGVLLPTTPLHVELFRDPEMPALVMTSANMTDEPICRGNREALERLANLADRYLLHDRDVVRRVDDSVHRSAPGGAVTLRRARGWVPVPEALPCPAPTPIVAMGGHLQVAACVATDDSAFITQHVGDLDSEPARAFHLEVIAGMEDFLQVEPDVLVCDLHPDYPSTWAARALAEQRGGTVIEVQHHLAHAAAVLAEHGVFPQPAQRRLAITLDGTGWGPDSTAWGGEWLLLGGDLHWQRAARLQGLPLVGGELAVREPWRVAVAALVRSSAKELIPALPWPKRLMPQTLITVSLLAKADTWPLASGAGRLFEACGALLGLVTENRWEGEAAARLESLAATADDAELWQELSIDRCVEFPELPSTELLAAAARRVVQGEDKARIAASFHRTFCVLAAELTQQIQPGESAQVAIGGGCLVNRLLRRGLAEELARRGFTALLPHRIPPGDGGLAYGQAVLAATALHRGIDPIRLTKPS